MRIPLKIGHHSPTLRSSTQCHLIQLGHHYPHLPILDLSRTLPNAIGGVLSIDLPLLLLLHLQQQRSVDMRQDTTERDRGPDKGVEFLVAADGELQVARGDALDFEVLGGVAGEFENFSGEILEDGSDVYGSWKMC